MKDINNRAIDFMRLFNVLSLDVVVGSLACGILIAKMLNVRPDLVWWIILPISVWIVYTADHLIDSFRLKYNAHSIRHRFHYYHRKSIYIALLITIITGIIVIIFLDKRIILFGLFLSFFTSIYLLSIHLIGHQQMRLMQKELFVAIIYTAGIWGGPLVLVDSQITCIQYGYMICFFLLVLVDILLLSYFDIGIDRLDRHNNFIGKYGKQLFRVIFYFSLAGVFCYCIMVVIFLPTFRIFAFSSIYLMMAIGLILLFCFEASLRNKFITRYLLELIFWIPFLALFLD